MNSNNRFHQSNIKRLKQDPVSFVEFVYMDLFGEPIKLKGYQKQLIRKLSKKIASKLEEES